MNSTRAAFLDRDGVINVDRDYVHRIMDFEFLPGVLAACRRIVAADYRLVVITNQAGIARGYYGLAEFEQLNNWMARRFAEAGAPLTAVYYCPHHPDGTVDAYRKVCDCRKPSPGLIIQATRDHDICLRQSFLVGDKPSDIEAGRRAGVARCFLLGTTGGPAAETACADAVVANLNEVADLVIAKP
jgi:D-glycero-D-manno-heptose 1,7-bisphosphate phosphatase